MEATFLGLSTPLRVIDAMTLVNLTTMIVLSRIIFLHKAKKLIEH